MATKIIYYYCILHNRVFYTAIAKGNNKAEFSDKHEMRVS